VAYFVTVSIDNNDFNVFLRRGSESTGFSSASVQVNGLTLGFTPYYYYYARPTPDLMPGANVEMRVTVPEGDITAHDSLPALTGLTEPTEGSSISVSGVLNVTWTSASNPDEFRLSYARAGDSISYNLGVAGGSARSFNVPANTLPANARLICVYAVNSGTDTLTGPFSNTSTFEVSGNYACVNVTTGP
jgi:hypothetical protein